MTRLYAILAAAVAAAGLAAGAAFVYLGRAGDPFSDCRGGAIATGGAGIGGPFSLIDASGARVSEADVIDKPTLLYFGYGFCPDFCPTDLARNALAADLLADRGVDAGLVFISIDPERDPPAEADAFARSFHPDMIGLSGSAEDVAAAAAAYRVYYRKSGDDPENYLMDHSTFTYLAAPGHPFLEFYPTDAAPEAIADSVACYAARL